ncbi:unnamed protein product [Kuraishia capsulata CBS 1993]|uniref:mRNA m(6)A methyltransferase n=1 Tax=Kuraishia capsulata CBS 1993 TaxID=1382522 RepID=W6ML54_9ASCO|nr:uncharacterized protein KUCA_T00003192001 [Kuraishia capsulata CBS 1993]CDK27214.1 unnamed protein product [Kuraishia capsulata CBS 1993]
MSDLCTVADFFRAWNKVIVTRPIGGSLLDAFGLFEKTSNNQVSWNSFLAEIEEILKITNAIQFDSDLDPKASQFGELPAIVSIDTLQLQLLVQAKQAKEEVIVIKKDHDQAESSKPVTLENFMQLIHSDNAANAEDVFSATSNKTMLWEISQMVTTPLASHSLSSEKVRLVTRIEPFVDICDNKHHAEAIRSASMLNSRRAATASTVTSDPQQIQAMLRGMKSDPLCVETAICMDHQIHFLPLLHRSTDPQLGDCSYLDTCHKQDSCRYLHYQQLLPRRFKEIVGSKEIAEHNRNCDNAAKSAFFTKGEVAGASNVPELPAQWINCDVRFLDFSILGKFAAIVADPSWAINMRTPNKVSKDPDLMSLPIHLLQDEGVIFLWVTGRTTDVGRQVLSHWGYKPANEISWIKTNQLIRTICTGRTGHWLNHSKEHLQVGIKGNPKWLTKGSDQQTLVSSTRQTSRKPDELYGLIERLVGKKSRKLEIFGKDYNTRPGWLTIGDELKGSHIVERDVADRYVQYLGKA